MDPDGLFIGAIQRGGRYGVIKILYKQPGLPAKEMLVPNKLSIYQSLVAGDIQAKEVFKHIAMITNQEGKLREMDANFKYGFVTIYGPAVFVGTDKGRYQSITEFQREVVLAMLGERTGNDNI